MNQLKSLHFWAMLAAAAVAVCLKADLLPTGTPHDLLAALAALLAGGGYQLAFLADPPSKDGGK